MVKPHSPSKGGSSGDRSTLMTDGEFEDFWLYLDARHQHYAAQGTQQPTRNGITRPRKNSKRNA